MTELKDSRFTISIHALREEGDHTPVTVRPSRLPFLSTPSARRATSCPAGCRLSAWISIHALREEGDATSAMPRMCVRNFYPRPPRGGRPEAEELPEGGGRISIHALREEGDAEARPAVPDREDFYPRPPRGGRRAFHTSVGELRQISIHALREEGDGVEQHGKMRPMISIHALREEGDPRLGHTRQTLPNFYPRPPRGGRPGEKVVGVGLFGISIHALREEGDGAYPPWRPARCNFYPRPPRGGRRCIGFAPVSSLVFLSTPSARRATACNVVQIQLDKISIHALREEGDRIILIQYWPVSNFYPRPPRGGRLGLLRGPCRGSGDFYPRPPRGGRPAGAAACRCG